MPIPSRAVVRFVTALLCGGVCAISHAAGEAQRIAVELSKQTQGTVGTLACARYGVAAETVGPAFRWAGDPQMARVTYVPVRCAAHAGAPTAPVHYNVNCEGRDGRWRCHDGREALSVPTRLGDVSIEPGSFSHEQAIRAVQAAAASNRYRAEIEAALPSGCGLYVDVSAHMNEIVDLSCNNGRSFLISFWCPQSDCPRLLSVRR